ncbi:long-chain fatty acid--CoA ligase [Glaciecola punicea]|jgi:long-chain acyl-CoA synthetase|uniref:AMP-binding protein n=1 Tax=Glaciecola punicea TaxID=56804 RepID=UPI000872D127|nr:AMP-binding protein [Glaciecola punicea]OFA31146.1 long-chain fatty acid--CoA ligase [Glaciecola punicea]
MATINSLADLIEQTLIKYSDKPAFHCLGQTLTFAEIERQSYVLAVWLQQRSGLQTGDRIAIQLPNLIQYPIAAYAALRAGLVLVNTNPLYTTREMQHQFKDSGAKAIIILADLYPKLAEIQSQTDIRQVILTQAADLLSTDQQPTTPEGTHQLLNILNAHGNSKLVPRKNQSLDDVCVLQYTGGTTGVSKGAMLTNANIISNAQQVSPRLGFDPEVDSEIFVCPLPLYHIYAFTINMVVLTCSGSLNILIPNPRDLSGFINAIKPFRFTGFAGLNTLFIGLCGQPEFHKLDFSRLKITISGGTALTTSAAELWMKVTGCSIAEGYGLSETSPVLCMNEPGRELMGTVGLPLPDTTIKFINAQGTEVVQGEEGELVARGPQIMQGYWQRLDETAKSMTSDGFFKTGDIGLALATGHIKIVDRLKDMIIVSGFNVYPNEVEQIITQHPNVLEAAVIGELCEHSGERVCAYITLQKDLTEAELIHYCRDYLTGYKVPKKVVIMQELPKSAVGKILRRELRK